MPSLRELQLEFMQHLFARGHGRAPDFIRERARDPARGFAAYRNNAYGNLRHALRSAYPVVERLVGIEFFGFAADAYIDGHASRSGDLNQYGGEFPTFLLAFPPAQRLPYLADVAALEWACHEAHTAADAASSAACGLAAISPQDYGRLICMLHPSARLLRSRYPILDIWEKNQPVYTGDQRVDLDQGGDDLLICRTTCGDISAARLQASEWTFLSLLAQGHCLQDAYDQLLGMDAAFDPAAALQKQLVKGVLVEIALPTTFTQE